MIEYSNTSELERLRRELDDMIDLNNRLKKIAYQSAEDYQACLKELEETKAKLASATKSQDEFHEENLHLKQLLTNGKKKPKN